MSLNDEMILRAVLLCGMLCSEGKYTTSHPVGRYARQVVREFQPSHDVFHLSRASFMRDITLSSFDYIT